MEAFFLDKKEIVLLKETKGESRPHVEHRNLLRVHGTVCLKKKDYLVVEKCHSFSFEQLSDRFPFSDKLIAKYLKQLLEGLEALHQQHQAHNWINLGTVHATTKGNIIIDQTEARHQQLSEADKAANFPWLSPEQLKRDESGPLNDSWAVGCLALLLATGNPHSKMHPYFSEASEPQLSEIRSKYLEGGKESREMPNEEEISLSLFDLISACLEVNPKKRQKVSNLLKLPFFE